MAHSSLLRPRPPTIRTVLNGGAKSPISFVADKYPFLLKVFMILLLQLGVSFYTMYRSKSTEELRGFARRYILTISIVQIAIILVLALLPLPILPKLLIFTLFSVLNGLLIPLYVPNLSTKDVIDSALQTAVLFVSMIVAGLVIVYSGIDVGFFELALFVMSIVMLVWGIYIVFFQSRDSKRQRDNMTWYRNFSILLFALYIVYDTYNILRVDYGGDFVTAAFDYYLDVFNIFRNLLILEDTNE